MNSKWICSLWPVVRTKFVIYKQKSFHTPPTNSYFHLLAIPLKSCSYKLGTPWIVKGVFSQMLHHKDNFKVCYFYHVSHVQYPLSCHPCSIFHRSVIAYLLVCLSSRPEAIIDKEVATETSQKIWKFQLTLHSSTHFSSNFFSLVLRSVCRCMVIIESARSTEGWWRMTF